MNKDNEQLFDNIMSKDYESAKKIFHKKMYSSVLDRIKDTKKEVADKLFNK